MTRAEQIREALEHVAQAANPPSYMSGNEICESLRSLGWEGLDLLPPGSVVLSPEEAEKVRGVVRGETMSMTPRVREALALLDGGKR